MTIAYVNNNGLGAAVVSAQSTPIPAGTGPGDLLLSECFVVDADVVLSVSGGWNLITQLNLSASGGNYTVGIAWRVATGSTSAEQPTWSIDGGASHTMQSNTWRFTGAYTTQPVGNYAVALLNTGTTAGNTSINATAAASTMVSFVDATSNQAVPTPTNFTSQSLFQSATLSERMSTRPLVNSGDASGSTAITISSAKSWSFLVELRSQQPIPVPTNFKAWLWR